MFKSIKTTRLESGSLSIEIIDSDFIESIVLDYDVKKQNAYDMQMLAIIKIYSNRKLNVANNIILYLLKMDSDVISWGIKNEIQQCSIHVPEFNEYRDAVERMLVLI